MQKIDEKLKELVRAISKNGKGRRVNTDL